MGHLGKDPEIRTFENGSKKASFSLATTEYRKDKDGNRIEMTEWHNIVMWRNLAEPLHHGSGGQHLYLPVAQGKQRSDSDAGAQPDSCDTAAATAASSAGAEGSGREFL